MGYGNSVPLIWIERGGMLKIVKARKDKILRLDNDHIKLFYADGVAAKYSKRIRKGKETMPIELSNFTTIPPMDTEMAINNPELIRIMIIGTQIINQEYTETVYKPLYSKVDELLREKKKLEEKNKKMVNRIYEAISVLNKVGTTDAKKMIEDLQQTTSELF